MAFWVRFLKKNSSTKKFLNNFNDNFAFANSFVRSEKLHQTALVRRNLDTQFKNFMQLFLFQGKKLYHTFRLNRIWNLNENKSLFFLIPAASTTIEVWYLSFEFCPSFSRKKACLDFANGSCDGLVYILLISMLF